MLDLRTPKAKAEAKAKFKEWEKEFHLTRKRRKELSKKIWDKVKWLPIATCPFRDYEHEKIFISDGKKTCLVEVKKRYGTPVICIKKPVLVMTDEGLRSKGGEYAKIKAPKWWFKWEFENIDGETQYAGGHDVGKNEAGFIATKWLPMPPNME